MATFMLSDDRWAVRFMFVPIGGVMRLLERREEFFQKLDGGPSYRDAGAVPMLKCWEVV